MIDVLTAERWLETHPYLRPVAELDARVGRAVAELDLPEAVVPEWEAHLAEYRAGVPLLSDAGAGIDLEPAASRIGALVRRLEPGSLPAPLGTELSALREAFGGRSGLPVQLGDWLLADEPAAVPSPGLLRYLGWAVLARHLRPVVEAFGQWRDEERWLLRYCPTCGSPPAMAQIAGVDPARHRLLSCGRCRTAWRYRRTQCPFCETDVHRLAAIKLNGEAGLRIDHCESCKGYLKTYEGQGNEELLLADWSSLHLDLLAHDRGLKRMAASMYDLDPLLAS